MEDVVVAIACRTAAGDFGELLKAVPPVEPDPAVVRAVLDRGGV